MMKHSLLAIAVLIAVIAGLAGCGGNGGSGDGAANVASGQKVPAGAAAPQAKTE